MTRTSLQSISGVVLGLAAWVSGGVLAITPVSDQHVSAGLLPAAPLLAIATVVGVRVTFALRRMPLGVLLLPAVTIVPWLGLRSPGTLIWSGALALLPWALFATAACEHAPRRLRRAIKRGPTSLVIAAFAVATFAAGATRAGITGDQPHYLLISESLLHDGDFDLANDYDAGRYRAFYPGTLDPHHTMVTASRHEYSFHGIGVGVLVAPAYAVAGLIGVQAFMAMIAIGTAVLLWNAVRDLTGEGPAARAATAALLFQLPFLAQSIAIYPEVPAGAITALALMTLVRLERESDLSFAALIAAAAGLAALPWLHIRLSLIAGILGGAIAIALARRARWKALALFAALPAVSAVVFFASSVLMFGTIDPTAVFRQKAGGSLSGLPAGALGLLFDRQYGLLVYAPAMVFAVAGGRRLWSRAPLTAAATLTIVITTWLLGASFVWWGGTSSPARFLVPVLPAMALSIGAWWPGASELTRRLCVAAIVVGAVAAAMVALADRGAYVATDAEARATILDWINRQVSLATALPTFMAPHAWSIELLVALTWTVSAAMMTCLVFVVVRRTAVDVQTLGAWSLVVGVSLAASAAWIVRGTNPLTSGQSELALLDASQRSWLSTPWLDGRPAGTIEEVLSALHIETRDPSSPQIPLYVPSPPVGRYQIEVMAPAAFADPDAILILEGGRGGTPLWTWRLDAPADAPSFHLAAPVHSIRVRIRTTRPVVPAELHVRLHPIGTAPAAADLPAGQAAQLARFGDSITYLWDAGAVVESGGFWVSRGRPVTFLCTTLDGSAPCARLLFEAGRLPADVELRQGAWTQQVSLAALQRVTVSVPAGRIASTTVQTTSGADTRAVFISVPAL